MTDELEKKLIEKYPKIFADCSKDETVSCMAFGLECGDGWYNLIDILCEALTYTYTTSIKIDEEDARACGIEGYTYKDGETLYFYKVESPQVVAEQVKEKFGSLRFYYRLEYDPVNLKLAEKYPQLKEDNKRYANFIDGIIHFAESASSHTCEVTGTKGTLCCRGGWLKTLNADLIKSELKYEGYKPYVPSNETQNQ